MPNPSTRHTPARFLPDAQADPAPINCPKCGFFSVAPGEVCPAQGTGADTAHNGDPHHPSTDPATVERRKLHLLRLLALLDYMGGRTPAEQQQAIADLTDYCANADEDTEADGEAVAHAAACLLGVPFKTGA